MAGPGWKTLSLLAICWLALERASLQAQTGEPPPRHSFIIDPRTPAVELLPTPPEPRPVPLPWLVDDLKDVPEILFQKVVRLNDEPPIGTLKNATLEDLERLTRSAKMRAIASKKTAYGLAKINYLNKGGVDHFLKVLIENRPDLAGLPFVMKDAARTGPTASRAFIRATTEVRQALLDVEDQPVSTRAEQFWARHKKRVAEAGGSLDRKADDRLPKARLAALMQILAPESEGFQLGLVTYLRLEVDPESYSGLAKLVLFSPDKAVRDAALGELKGYSTHDESVLEAIRYPWPAVADHAADAIIKLERQALLPKLVDILDEPDVRAPIATAKGPVVREVVRINHHLNCLLCHAPANTADMHLSDSGKSSVAVVAPVAIPGEFLPSADPSSGYGGASPDIFVRVDVNYLRPDFSLMQPVKDASPWPEMQRFDFIVRTRAVTDKDVAAYKAWRAKQGDAYVAPNHAAALKALRALTGRDVGTTAAAWRRVIE